MHQGGQSQTLLALTGTGAEPDLSALTPGDWQVIDSMAAQHRLRPLLHAQHRDNAAIPAELRAMWQAAHRLSTLTAMTLRADLDQTVHLLHAGGFDPLVLKGGSLAWHVYPEPAQRPLRDIDLLLPETQFLAAWDYLCAAGYARASEPELPLAELVKVDKSPPPLRSPRGNYIELHLHAWFPEGRLEYHSPPPDDAGLFSRARRDDTGMLHPAPDDMLAHLVIHALYSHRLDCGPLLLSDIDFLLRKERVDWAAFWQRATSDGWASGARLVLDLVRRYRGPPGLDLVAAPISVTPPDLLAVAEELLVQDLDTRSSAGVAASGLALGLKGLWPRITRRIRTRVGPVRHRDSTAEGGYLAWASARLRRTLGDLANPVVRRQSRQLAQLSRWLAR